ncbi:MAG: hypothetical protein V4505_25955 [Pseudomonadota bacterium]
MNARNILSASALALLGSLAAAAHAGGELDDSAYRAQPVQSSRSTADAHAEGVYAAQHISRIPAGSEVHPIAQSGTARATVRQNAIQAARSGDIATGEYLKS